MTALASRDDTPTPEAATAFIDQAEFVWHQRFELAPDVWTPGVSPIPGSATWPGSRPTSGSHGPRCRHHQCGHRVRDGAPRRRARGRGRHLRSRLVRSPGTDRVPRLQGRVRALHRLRAGRALPRAVRPGHLLGRALPPSPPAAGARQRARRDRREASLETAVCDGSLPRRHRAQKLARFYRRDELSGDGSNWFAPTVSTLEDWCGSSGFSVQRTGAWPERGPERAMLTLSPTEGPAEYEQLSYERPLRCTIA